MPHTVLLVDDDPLLLAGLTRALRRQPYQLLTAQSADEAIWTLKKHDVDLLVTDEQMPGRSGSELAAWVAEHRPEVVRIMLTGHAEAGTAIRAINEGAVYHFFTKPCDEVQLAVTIRKALEHKDLLAERARLLDLTQRQVRELERLSLDREYRTRVISEDLCGAVERTLAACRRAAELGGDALPPAAAKCLREARDAAAEAERVLAALRTREPCPALA